MFVSLISHIIKTKQTRSISMFALAIIFITCLLMISSILFFPNMKIRKQTINLYWVISLIGALILTFSGTISLADVKDGLFSNSAINPIKILILFFSMTFLSIFLDEVGFFKYIANQVLKKSGTSQKKLFFLLFAIISFLTIFTSNDIIILTFTPIICYFAKNAKINPLPYLFCEFAAANTWSMLLIIGNPTNIYLGTSAHLGFIEYSIVMLIPTIVAGLSTLGVLYIIFWKKLRIKIENPIIEDYHIADKPLLIMGLIHLATCTILLVISSYINLEMWSITFLFAGSLILFVLGRAINQKHAPKQLINSLKRLPYELIPFILSMFIVVLCLREIGFTSKIADFLGFGNPIFTYGISSFFSANIINNIPMSVLFEAVSSEAAQGAYKAAIYSSIIGSNIGALLTPIGALAGIMWMNSLRTFKIKVSFLTFIKYSAIIGIVSLTFSLFGLFLVL